MTSWTPDALALFQRRCEERRDSLLALGADPDEVFADWKGLVESHAAAAGETGINAARAQTELDAILHSSDALPAINSRPDSPPVLSSRMRTWFGRGVSAILWIFGVLLPLGVLVFEGLTGACTEILFDPIPTAFHALLIALVPAANAAALLIGTRSRAAAAPRLFRWIGAANGFALGIAAYYALQFAIVTPFAAIAILYFGIGFIPLSPLLAFLSGLGLRVRLGHARFLTETPPVMAGWKTILPAFLLMILIGLPQSIVQSQTVRANDPDPAVRGPALRLLRTCGDRDLLLRKCYRSGENIDLTSLLLSRFGQQSPSTDDARQAYYRVTGMPFNAVPPPRLRGLRGQSLIDDSWFDPALGGDQVAGRIKDLSLSQSRLDGRVDTASGLAYLEWTMEFRNASKTAREARALIELPPGAVVSRVTLWINGEPCEAAFGGRSQTRRAYQQVAVRQRRDPVLVTTAGPDRILLQCFPVPVGGVMKTRIGISAPLFVPNADQAEAALRLPRFAEQNFTAASNLQTVVWLESDQPVAEKSNCEWNSVGNDPVAIRGRISADCSETASVIRLPLARSFRPVAVHDARLPAGTAILQTLEASSSPPAFPAGLAIVIDGSARMQDYKDLMTKTIFDLIPNDTEVRTFIARDETEVIDSKPPGLLRFAGGCDNGPALASAAEWSVEHNNAPILWLHAAQPLDSTGMESLRQIADFSRGALVIYSRQFGSGTDRISEQLADLHMVRPLPVLQEDSLESLNLIQKKSARWLRRQVPDSEIPEETAEGSSHIARLWAADEINRLSAPHRKTGHDEAVELARSFQLVTPVSGAVVLETAAQYKANGLEPADPASTPGIVPEPATIGLLLLGTPFLLALRRRRAV